MLGESEAYIALVKTMKEFVVFTKLVKKWNGCYFDKVTIGQLFLKINYTESFKDCQKHGPIQQVPTSELHYVTKPWPFRGWTLDLIGQIHPLSWHRYILVGVDYFMKWLEVIPLKDVDQGDIINSIEQNIIFIGQKMVQYANSRNIKLLTSTLFYA